MNLHDILLRSDRAGRTSVFVTSPHGARWSYDRLEDTTSRFAAVFRDHGVAERDRVVCQVEKSPEALCLYLACLRGGFVFHPLNMAYTSSELEYFLNNAEPAVVISQELPVQ